VLSGACNQPDDLKGSGLGLRIQGLGFRGRGLSN